MSNGQNGKGSKQRPRQIPREEFDKRWDAIFNKDKKDGNKSS